MVQLTFKKLLLIEFCCGIKEYPQLPEELIKLPHVCVRLDHLFQSKEHVTTDRMQRKI